MLSVWVRFIIGIIFISIIILSVRALTLVIIYRAPWLISV